MKRLFYLFVVLCFSSCLGDDYDYYETSDGATLYNNTVLTSEVAFDPVNVAIRFSFLIDEIGGFGEFANLENASTNIDGKEYLIRELLFGEQANCVINCLEENNKYAITYYENFYLLGDKARYGSFIITTGGLTLLEDGSSWTVKMGTGTEENNIKAYKTENFSKSWYGDETEVSLYRSQTGVVAVESRCYAELYNGSSSNPDADWTFEMLVDFGSDDFSFITDSNQIEMSYSAWGDLLNTDNGGIDYEQETTSNLIYDRECSKTIFQSGTIKTTNTALGTGWDLALSYSILERTSGSNCTYTNQITYNGYTETW